VLADQARGRATCRRLSSNEQSAQAFATQLVTAEQSSRTSRRCIDQSLGAAEQAKKAVERN